MNFEPRSGGVETCLTTAAKENGSVVGGEADGAVHSALPFLGTLGRYLEERGDSAKITDQHKGECAGAGKADHELSPFFAY